ncbi:MAG: CD225/dispanin family protein [Acidobacteria bacterium]|nr:CD225/dispanin family protein [Acidobacteriota bacterium]
MSFLGLDDRERGTSVENSQTPEVQAAEEKAVIQQADSIFIFSVISVLFCCIGGLIASYFAYQGKQDANVGNVLGAEHNIRLAKGWMIAAFIIGTLGIIGKLSERR